MPTTNPRMNFTFPSEFEKSDWTKHAKNENLSLTAWMIKNCRIGATLPLTMELLLRVSKELKVAAEGSQRNSFERGMAFGASYALAVLHGSFFQSAPDLDAKLEQILNLLQDIEPQSILEEADTTSLDSHVVDDPARINAAQKLADALSMVVPLGDASVFPEICECCQEWTASRVTLDRDDRNAFCDDCAKKHSASHLKIPGRTSVFVGKEPDTKTVEESQPSATVNLYERYGQSKFLQNSIQVVPPKSAPNTTAPLPRPDLPHSSSSIGTYPWSKSNAQ